MKGIVLAGGLSSRLMPLTQAFSKQLLPVYDKPMIYYPLSVLMLSGIREILIITTKRDKPLFRSILGDGSNFGVNITFEIQDQPNGIAEAFIVGKKFIGDDNVCLILGDNIFFGYQFVDMLNDAASIKKGATIFSTIVKNPSEFGVVELNESGQILSLEEKPSNPKSNLAVTGLYFYDNNVVTISEALKPSNRGELEITDINQYYFEEDLLNVVQLGRGFSWLDTGTHQALLNASEFVRTIEKRQGLKLACLEEIALNNSWISEDQVFQQSQIFKNSPYGQYLRSLIGK